MLLLPRTIQALHWEDLTKDEQDKITSVVNGRLQYAFILRHGYCSTVAFQKKAGRRFRFKEVERYLVKEDKKVYCDYLWFNALAGWRTYMDTDCDHLWVSDYGDSNDGPNGYNLYTKEQFIAWCREAYPYFDMKNDFPQSFMWKNPRYKKPYCVLREYMANLPESELFFKAGFPRFAMSKKLCHLTPKRKKAFIRWLKTRTTKEDLEALANEPIGELLSASAKGVSMSEHYKERALSKIGKALTEHGFDLSASDVVEYLTKKAGVPFYDVLGAGEETNRYINYLMNCRALEYDLSDKGVVMPRDFQTAVLITEKKKNAERMKVIEKGVKKFAMELGEQTYEGGIEIKPLSSVEEFVKMGSYFKNCVGRCSYDGKMAERRSYVVIVYKDKQPVECVEISAPTRQILQELGVGNVRSNYYPQLNPLVAEYAKTREYSL